MESTSKWHLYMSQHLIECHFNTYLKPRIMPGRKGGAMKEKVDMNLAMLIVYNTLGIGKENAVSRRQIVESTGYPDRLIRECIERLREEEPILSATDGSGYYIATEDAQGVTEAVEWVTGQNRRAKSIRKSCSGAQKLISRVQQMEMGHEI